MEERFIELLKVAKEYDLQSYCQWPYDMRSFLLPLNDEDLFCMRSDKVSLLGGAILAKYLKKISYIKVFE
jgi:hypothetical protein